MLKRILKGKNFPFFSRYHDSQAAGVDLFAQQLHWLKQVYCFPPIPIVGLCDDYPFYQRSMGESNVFLYHRFNGRILTL